MRKHILIMFSILIIFLAFPYYVYLYLIVNQMADLKPAGNTVCNLIVLPELVIQEDVWISVDTEMSMFVFSAYYVGQRKKIYVIGAKIHNDTFAFCQLSYVSRNSTTENLTIVNEVEINMKPDGIENKYTSTIFECHVDTVEIPKYISIVKTPCQTPRYLLLVKDVTPVDKYQYKFTVCLSPLFNVDNSKILVEWIELNRLLGAEKIQTYNFSAAPRVQHVLNYYSNKGLMEVIKWRPEVSWNGNASEELQIHYHAQTASLNDCLYRRKRDSEFVVNLDLDEFIIPHGRDVNNWSSMIALIDRSRNCFITLLTDVFALISEPVNAYVFRNTFFTIKLENIFKNAFADRPNLVTLRVFEREKRIFPVNDRTKYITRTADVDSIHIHLPDTKYASVQPDVGLLHHYRREIPDTEKGKSGGYIYDLTVKEKFGIELAKRVEAVSQEILHN